MSKKSGFRGPFDNQHGKRAKTLLKSEPKNLYHIYWSLWSQFMLKKALWVIWKILGLFLNPLTADEKYSLLNGFNFLEFFQIQIFLKLNIFSEFCVAFSKFSFNFEHFQKRMTLIAEVFLNLRIRKNVVR